MLSELLDFREANTEFASLGPDGKPKSLWQENRVGKALRLSACEL